MSAQAVNDVVGVGESAVLEFLVIEHDGVKQSVITLAFRPPLLKQ